MSSFCLPLLETQKFLEAIKDGSLDLKKMSEIIDSGERRALFEKYVGKENAQAVNALFEEKLLLKDWQSGMINFIKKTGNMTVRQRLDTISKLERMDKILSPNEEGRFLKDLAARKLGLKKIDQKEMTNLTNLTTDLTAKKKPVLDILQNLENAGKTLKEINDIALDKTSDLYKQRIEYGLSLENLKDYVTELKNKQQLSAKELLRNPIELLKKGAQETTNTVIGLLTTLDNSFFGRQGIKLLYSMRNADIWGKTFMSSWSSMVKEFAGQDVMKAIKAEVNSRPNALNGNYDNLGKGSGLNVSAEEQFPPNVLEKIKVVKNIYKGFETAFSGSALRMRADYADRLIDLAEKQGVNIKDKAQMEGVGNLIGASTGRYGSKYGEGPIKALLFAPKFLFANFHTLTAHLLDPKATSFTKKQAAMNLAAIVTSIAVIDTISNSLNGPKNQVEKDPRSSNFTKVPIGGVRFDISGGMASLVTLASRILPLLAGQKGYTKSTTTGKLNEINKKDKKGNPLYGAQTGFDVITDFLSGKLSPAAKVVVDGLKGEMFGNKPVTLGNELKANTIPLPAQDEESIRKYLSKASNADFVAALILSGLGFAPTVPQKKK